jgi:glycine dehydrogenase subunit 2
MSMNREGRPTRPEASEGAGAQTWTGNRALMLEEPLIFEIGDSETTGVDFEQVAQEVTIGHRAREHDEVFYKDRLGGLQRRRPIGLAGLSEPQAVRHYTRLSRQSTRCRARCRSCTSSANGWSGSPACTASR